MTIERIISIKNVGRFLNAAATGDVTLRRCNLIFAENGRGKTTLCAILRSLQSGDPANVMGRKTLGHQDDPRIQIRLVAGNANFTNRAWDRTAPNVAVFDSTYVSDNVHAGEIVTVGHRRNLYRAIIGREGVDLARRIEEIDAQVREKNTAIREARAEVQRHVPPSMQVDAFIALENDPDIDAKIAATEQELVAVRQAARIRERQDLRTIVLPPVPWGLGQVLGGTVENVSAEAERLVRDHIAARQMKDGETWIVTGLSYLHDDCPFCGQGLEGIGLIEAYKNYFTRAYHDYRWEIDLVIEAIKEDLDDAHIAAVERTVEQNASAGEFWADYCAIPALHGLEQLADTLRDVRGAAFALLARKVAAPFEALVPDDNFARAVTRLREQFRVAEAYNAAIGEANATIAQKKREVERADAAAVQAKLTRLNAQKMRHAQAAQDACAAYAGQQALKEVLEAEKAQARVRLDGHTGRVIDEYGASINTYLNHINAGFRITVPRHNYQGGVPGSSYRIVINGAEVELGDVDTPLDEPSFRNTLSAGDRSTLALAFFLAELDQDRDKAQKIVVFDDPFSSQDSFRRNNTAYQLKKCAQNCAQVIVLSHDPFFLKLVWDKLPVAERKALQLGRVGETNTTISEWDIERAVQAQYRADLATLHAYHAGREGQPRDVIQKIRPVLEGYCRNLYPTQFRDVDMMGDIIGAIHAAGDRHPLNAVADQLEEINEYCRRYHHAENPNAATEAINDGELQNYVKRTLVIAGCII